MYNSSIAFGPVPSRRLGRSLGINNIPPKVCTYSCVYCQVGRTKQMQVERNTFYAPEKIFLDIQERIKKVKAAGEIVDYLTFVPDGEPTLDINLGREIQLLKELGIPIAVITNNSLTSMQDVRAELKTADWISLKVDAIDELIWQRINRPIKGLKLAHILDGALRLAEVFRGLLVTETMLISGINDDKTHLQELADFLARLTPHMVYLATPTRPPAEKWVQPADEFALIQAYQIISEKVKQVELLTGYEGHAFTCTGDVVEDLLSIVAVHPMRREAIDDFLARAKADWSIIRKLIQGGQLAEMEYQGQKYYLRRQDDV